MNGVKYKIVDKLKFEIIIAKLVEIENNKTIYLYEVQFVLLYDIVFDSIIKIYSRKKNYIKVKKNK